MSLTIMALIVLGGLGFFVWSDVWDHRRFRSLSLHSKLVLAMSGVLLGGGFLLTLLFEWSNPATLGRADPAAQAARGGVSERDAAHGRLQHHRRGVR